MKHVVVVGGGFAGVKLARELQHDHRFLVTLISSNHYFEYHAALYRSATGRSHLEVAVPLEEIFAGTNVDVVRDDVIKIDAHKRIVSTKGKLAYRYDELVIGTGVTTSFFGIKGLPQYSYGMKSMVEAEKLKAHLHSELTSGHKPDLNYVVVGAGPSGVELAAEMVSYLSRLRKKHGIKKQFHVDLVEAAPRILPNMSEAFAETVMHRLQSLGVYVYTDTMVKAETADKLILPHGSIDTHTVVWTAGMTNSPLPVNNPKLFKLGKGARVEVGPKLEAAEHIWVAGDSADTKYTGWAQTACYDGWYLAENFRREHDGDRPLKYAPKKPIGAIPVGPHWCAVPLAGLTLTGYLGWIVRRYVDLKLMLSVLPAGMAWRVWGMGRIAEESCQICRSA